MAPPHPHTPITPTAAQRLNKMLGVFERVPNMNVFNSRFLVILAFLFFSAVGHAGTSAVVIIYQPIITESEAVTIRTPKGFAVMAIPFECFHFHGRPPFYAIAQPNPLLTDAPRSRMPNDANLLSLAGVTIGSSIDDDIVHVHFETLQPPAGFEITTDDVAEAALECIRRMAQNTPKRPTLKITGKQGEETKWLRWREHFQKHDLTKPYNRPNA